MLYQKSFWLNKNTGNNAFSWEDRKELGSQLKIYVPKLIEGAIAEIELGENIVFEEIKKNNNSDNNNKSLDAYMGLKHFVKTEREGKPVYIVDNHNHVLWFWYKFWKENNEKSSLLIHVDQHTDMNVPENFIEGESSDLDWFQYITETLNVGNFIVPAREVSIVDEIIQINTEYKLNQCLIFNKLAKLDKIPSTKKPIIVDIDLDFRTPEMGIEHMERSFEQVRKLCHHADIITVATSPYFLDQELAIKLIKNIFVN